MRLSSIIFHTDRLRDIRDFYEGKLNLPIGTYIKDGETVSDLSDTYVNYSIGESLLCFEVGKNETETGTVVLNVQDFTGMRSRLESAGVTITAGNSFFFKIKDPEGRTLIIEA